LPRHDTFCWSVRERRPRRKPRRFAPGTHFRLTVLLKRCQVEFWYSLERGFVPLSFTRLATGQSPVTTLYLPVMESRLKKRTPQAANGTGPKNLAAVESRVFGALMNIVAHLADVRYDDASPRTPGTLFIKTLGGAWLVTAKEPDAGCQLPVTANTLDDALAGLDLLLGADDAPWEIDPWARSRGQKKGKEKS
jgi:hypothetical protein